MIEAVTSPPNNGNGHRWRFFRSGGFDQVRIERVADLRALASLDLKLWAALACPVQGLEFDERTLRYIDTDEDGRIRVPEILAAVQWALDHLSDPELLFKDADLALTGINLQHESGQSLYNSARRILINLGKADATALGVADTADMAKIFPPTQANGDGIVPAALTTDEKLQAAIADIIATLGADTDRSGEPGVSAEKITQFFADAATLLAWDARHYGEAALQPFGAESAAQVAAYQAVAAKVDDYFMRVQFAAYDGRAQALMNGSEADLGNLAAQELHSDNAEALRLPLAQVAAGRELPLCEGLNPAWQAAVTIFREQVVLPLLGERNSLAQADWEKIKAQLSAYIAWQAEKPALAVEALGLPRLAELQNADTQAALLALVQQDLAVAAEADSILDVDKLLRLQRYLVPLLNNFVALRDFYNASGKAVFQAGRLYLDSRSFDLCVKVADVGKHAALASLSRTYLAYCDCTRRGNGTDKMTVVVAVTAGSVGNLMVGRNGVFYDRKGQDWDATVTRIVENPISIREAFWSPYRRMAKMLSEQMLKFAATRDQAVTSKTAQQIGDTAATTATAPAPVTPAAAPVPFDIGKMVGIFAAIGLALGAIGTALASVIGNFLGLRWWQMPLAIVGLLLLISGPAMVVAWFKLRGRNLGPILDASAWAVNTEAKINIPFGTALTTLAKLPEGAERSLTDPYANKSHSGLYAVILAVLVLILCFLGYKDGLFSELKATVEKPAAAVGK